MKKLTRERVVPIISSKNTTMTPARGSTNTTKFNPNAFLDTIGTGRKFVPFANSSAGLWIGVKTYEVLAQREQRIFLKIRNLEQR